MLSSKNHKLIIYFLSVSQVLAVNTQNIKGIMTPSGGNLGVNMRNIMSVILLLSNH